MSSETKVAFFALLAGFLAIRGYFARRARQSGHSASFTDERKAKAPGKTGLALTVVILLLIIGLLVLYAAKTEGSDWLSIPVPAFIRWAGVVLGLAALACQVWVHATLQNRCFSVTIPGEPCKLVTDGPYRWVRHPMYVALMVYFVALALVSAFSPFVFLALLMIALLRRAALAEERPLAERHPGEYEEYAARTPRFIPRFKLHDG